MAWKLRKMFQVRVYTMKRCFGFGVTIGQNEMGIPCAILLTVGHAVIGLGSLTAKEDEDNGKQGRD